MVITKKNTLMQEYSLNKEQFSDLVQYRKNYENYYGKEVERLKIEKIIFFWYKYYCRKFTNNYPRR